MTVFGVVLYVIAVAILLWMWLRVRGKSLEEIVKGSADQHHRLVEVFTEHPHGGSAVQVTKWFERKLNQENS